MEHCYICPTRITETKYSLFVFYFLSVRGAPQTHRVNFQFFPPFLCAWGPFFVRVIPLSSDEQRFEDNIAYHEGDRYARVMFTHMLGSTLGVLGTKGFGHEGTRPSGTRAPMRRIKNIPKTRAQKHSVLFPLGVCLCPGNTFISACW
jgi:hypothetical protein